MARGAKTDAATERVILEMFNRLGNARETARTLNIPRTTVRDVLARNSAGRPHGSTTESASQKFDKNSGEIEIKSYKIETLEAALEHAEVDLEVWEVDRWVANKWDMGYKTDKGAETKPLWQIKVWLKRRVPDQPEVAALERVAKAFKNPPKLPKPEHKPGDHLLFLGLHDSHFGLLAWREETGVNENVKITYHNFVSAGAQLLHKAGAFGVSKIVVPVGQDLFHTQRPDNVTARHGNALDVDSRLININEYAYSAVLMLALMCREIAPTEFVWVPGNHDPEASWWLAHSLAQYFRKDKYVSVDLGAKTRKYRQFGACLVGMTHGIDEKRNSLPMLMAAECREVWSQVRFCEMLMGHKHAKASWHYQETESMPGVRVRILPSLAGPDAWHFRKGYVHAGRAADAYLYHAQHGNVARLSCGMGELAAA